MEVTELLDAHDDPAMELTGLFVENSLRDWCGRPGVDR
jgi:hypothetical protein